MKPDLPLRATAPWAVLVVSLLFTVAAAAYVSWSVDARDTLRLHSHAGDIRAALDARMDAHIALLRAGTGLFAASDFVSVHEFRRFAEQLALREHFPGLLGIGYTRWLPPAAVPALEQEMKQQGIEDFRVWPPGPTREVYSSIVYLEPLDDVNRRAIGYDMFYERVRREAMQRALETGEPTASGRVVLVQEGSDDPRAPAGFLVYAPVYEAGARPATVEERRQRLLGFVYSPLRAGDLLHAVLTADERRQFVVRVYDGKQAADGTLLYDSGRRDPAPELLTGFAHTGAVEIAGRPWTVVVLARPEFSESAGSLVPAIFIIGLLVSVVLFVLTRAEARARLEAELNAAALRRSKEELDVANRAKDEFLATLSHELRTPLNAILGWTRMLRMGHLDQARQADALEVVERNARVQVRLIEDLLDVSRIITGKLRLELRPVALAPALEEAANTVRPSAEVKGVRLVCEWDPEVGQVTAAPERLQQVLWNLLSNAIKFTPRGGSVRFQAERADGAIRIVVADTGVGIKPEFLPHVFERFRQADSSTTRAHSGVGLGLAIVRHLVELHGGTIEAVSAGEGRGATFTVTLRQHTAAALPHAADAVRSSAAATDLAGVRVLVVDDEADARTVAAAVLESHGAGVHCAASVREALAVVEREAIDVVVADLAMPGEDGYALLAELRPGGSSRGQGLPVIAVTAYARAEDRAAALERGFHGYLPKPVEPSDLAALVADLARHAHGT
jgi:signal transduction histidine kinase/ActR/RegA family two-component response regulator